MAQFYLFRRTLNGAVLSVPKHFEWRSSICSDAYSMKQFYLFRRTINGAVLFVPLKGFWNCSNCSLPIFGKIFSANKLTVFAWNLRVIKLCIKNFVSCQRKLNKHLGLLKLRKQINFYIFDNAENFPFPYQKMSELCKWLKTALSFFELAKTICVDDLIWLLWNVQIYTFHKFKFYAHKRSFSKICEITKRVWTSRWHCVFIWKTWAQN